MATKPAKGDSLDEATRRYREAKAEAAELQTSQLKGQLVPRERLAEILTAIGAEVRKELSGLPRTWAPLLCGLDAREIEARLEEEVRRILLQLSRSRDLHSTPRSKLGPRPGRPKKVTR